MLIRYGYKLRARSMYLQPLRLNPPCRMIVCRFEIVVSPGALGVGGGKNRVRT